jgi:phosphatidylserine/phosphatidylglycerophosphate/cardiolipin synthase-like enzyme
VLRSLIVLPDDSAQPLLKLIHEARQSLRVKMFALSDPRVLRALIRAHGRGVKTRIMLNPARRSGELQNAGSRSVLRGAGIDVLDSNPAFEVTHEKSMVCDGSVALIGSANWEPETFENTRDYGIVTRDPAEVREIVECFEADWSRRPFAPHKASSLVWSPGVGRAQIGQFIDSAKHSVYVQNERYQDAIIVEHLVRAKLRGVKVHVMARPSHSLRAEKLVEGVGDLRILRDVGIGIRKIHGLRLHAKMLLADRSRAIVGSINLAPGSFDKRREVAIRVGDRDIVARLSEVVHDDWKHSRALDLSDRGLERDLKRHAEEGSLERAGFMGADLLADSAAGE